MDAIDGKSNFVTFVWLRQRAGLTQKELAARLEEAFGRSVTISTVSNWERGTHKPRLTPQETLLACSVLQCSLEELAIATRQTLKKVE
jgi:transcriptional regulator with XRE-family HTH domain